MRTIGNAKELQTALKQPFILLYIWNSWYYTGSEHNITRCHELMQAWRAEHPKPIRAYQIDLLDNEPSELRTTLQQWMLGDGGEEETTANVVLTGIGILLWIKDRAIVDVDYNPSKSNAVDLLARTVKLSQLP